MDLDRLQPRHRRLIDSYIRHGVYKAVAHEMGLSEQTVKNYAVEARRLMGAGTMTQACVEYDRASR